MQEFIKNRARQEIFKLKPYTPGKPIEEVKRELGLEDIIKLASNENPLGPAPGQLKPLAICCLNCTSIRMPTALT